MRGRYWAPAAGAAAVAVFFVSGCSSAGGRRHKLIKAHCPWQNGKVERLNRTLQTEWAYRQVFTTNAERSAALAPWLDWSTPTETLARLTEDNLPGFHS